MIDNTTNTPPELLLLDAIFLGPDRFVENMEERGQQQLVNSDLLPTDLGWDTQADYEALGFKFGSAVEDDPLFQHVELPVGWSRQGSSHAMHSHVVDERGIARVSVFYKAAFYDRRARMSIVNVGRDVASKHTYEGDDFNADSVWAILSEEEREDCLAAMRDYVAMHEEHPDIWASQGQAASAFLESHLTV